MRRCDTILILGDNPHMEYEAGVALSWLEHFDIMAINRAYLRWPSRVDFLVTYHGEEVEGWLRSRGWQYRPTVVTECGKHGVKFNPDCTQGGSATLGLRYAMALGYTEFVIAGVGLEGNYANFMPGFLEAASEITESGGKVRSANRHLSDALGTITRGDDNGL